jgi:23S rRNA pseudouridine1911/1915/1917 synthase
MAQETKVNHHDYANETFENQEQFALLKQIRFTRFIDQLGDFAHSDVHWQILDRSELHQTETDTLANVLVAKRPELVGIGKNPLEPGIVHRLDNGTSGLLLIAKSDHCFEKLLLLFRRHQLSKEYLALVEGKVAKSGEISSLLTHHPTEKERMMIAPKTKKIHPQHKKFNKSWPATTLFQPILHLDQHTLLRVRIPTGVTHQIRLHLSHLGHPVVGDTLYGKKSSMMPANSSRHFLHAYRLQFTHPITHQPIDCISTLPSDLQEILDSIGSKDRC